VLVLGIAQSFFERFEESKPIKEVAAMNTATPTEVIQTSPVC
jgi:hypothetical protein